MSFPFGWNRNKSAAERWKQVRVILCFRKKFIALPAPKNEKERDAQRDLVRETTFQAFERQKASAEDLDSLQRIIFGLKLNRPRFLSDNLEAIETGESIVTQTALNAWSDVHDEQIKASAALDELLRKAAEMNNLEITRLLLAWSADPASADPLTGQNALHKASKAPGLDADLLEELLNDAERHVDNVDLHSCTPLILAAQFQNEARIKALLRRGADPELANDEGKTALDYAQGECKNALTHGADLFWSSTLRISKLLAKGDFENVLRTCRQVR